MAFEALKRIWSTYYTIRLLCTAAGIIFCFFLYGVMQEKIMRVCYGGIFIDGKCSGQRFTFEMSLVLIYCVWYTIFARCELRYIAVETFIALMKNIFILILVLISFNNRCTFLHHAEKDKTYPLWYVATSLCYISAMVCSNMALRHINYPTQVIAKSSKPIPVMVS